MKNSAKQKGFTIVELLIVIVIIAILAAITVVAYNGIQSRSRTAKIQTDLSILQKSIIAGRINQSINMNGITLNPAIHSNCSTLVAGTDLAALPRTHACWTDYATALDRISVASGIDVRKLVDPWNRPYFIDSNEGESWNMAGCAKDQIAVYAMPFNQSTITNNTIIPLYATSCA